MIARVADLRRLALVAGLLTLGMAAAAAVAGVGAPVSLLLGGAFMLANLYLIRMLVSRLIRPGAGRGSTVFLLVSKFFLVLLLLAGVLYQFPVDPLSFAAGATTLVVAAVLEAVWLGSPAPPLPTEEEPPAKD